MLPPLNDLFDATTLPGEVEECLLSRSLALLLYLVGYDKDENQGNDRQAKDH
jgi:hypothetical protein